MKCLRCGNEDESYFYQGHKGYYCRKCIGFSRVLLEEDLKPLNYEIGVDIADYDFGFKLTTQQAKASKQCLTCLEYADVLLHCVCGAGKTEIVVETISHYLSLGLKVAYAIARREVVIELEARFKKIFKDAKVIGVYGGHHKELKGDLIICTTHQLYRYYKTFDLLILDEVDAFPLKGNEALMNISINACKGRIIFSTATVDEYLQKILHKRNYKKVELYVRPSLKPLIIPKVIYLQKSLHLIYLLYLLHSMTNQCIIFVSSKKLCKNLYLFFKHLFSCTYVYSDLAERESNIIDFKNAKYKYIFSTTVLERGITIKNISVIILSFDKTFDVANYIQMLGRVARGVESNKGKAYILSNHFDTNINKAIKYLKYANTHL